MSVSCNCCVLSLTGLCDGPISRPGESYRVSCVTMCDLEMSRMRRPWPTLGCCADDKNVFAFNSKYNCDVYKCHM